MLPSDESVERAQLGSFECPSYLTPTLNLIIFRYTDTWRQDPMDSSMYIRLLIGRYIPEALADAVLVFVLNEL